MNTTTQAAPSTQLFAVGDEATFIVHTDAYAGWIVRVSPNGRTVWFRRGKATLLNAANSGEPDALQFSPGGFVGHTSGVQRWEITRNPDAALEKFTLRGNGRWKAARSTNGPGLRLVAGHSHHYDFNF